LSTALEKDGERKKANNLGNGVTSWIKEMLQKAASGTWDIAKDAASEILTNAISAYYGGNK